MSLFPRSKPRKDNPFYLVISTDTPERDGVRSRDLVTLRCVAGKAFQRATGEWRALDLSEEQIFWGSMKPNDRKRFLSICPPAHPKPRT